jgi:hypothetical protein
MKIYSVDQHPVRFSDSEPKVTAEGTVGFLPGDGAVRGVLMPQPEGPIKIAMIGPATEGADSVIMGQPVLVTYPYRIDRGQTPVATLLEPIL